MEEQTIIIMAKRSDPFARIPKEILSRTDMSWKAKGVLCYLIGKPSGWQAHVTDIIRNGAGGRDAVRAALKEIRDVGYAEFVQGRGARSRFAKGVWKISDSPIFTVSPRTGFPFTDNPPHIKNDGTETETKATKDDAHAVGTGVGGSDGCKVSSSKQKRVPVTVAAPAAPPRALSARPPRQPRTLRIPTQEEFDAFVDAEDLEGIANHRDNLLNELIHGGWVDGKGRPIYDWKAFVSGLNDTIQPRR